MVIFGSLGGGVPLSISSLLPPTCPAPGPPPHGQGYWAGWTPGPSAAPFSWGVLDKWKKVLLMASWQVSMSLGTSTTVRPLVGTASSTWTLTVPGVGQQCQQLGATLLLPQPRPHPATLC